MFIKLYRANLQFQQLFLLALFCALLWLSAFINPIAPFEYGFKMPLYSLVFELLNQSLIINTIVAFLLLIVQTYLLNKAIRDSGLISKNSLFPALIYFFLMSADSDLLTLSPVLIANLFIIIALDLIFKIFAEVEPFAKIFNIGFYISIASLFYLPVIFFIVLFWMSFIIFRQITLRNFIISIIGLLTPYLFLVGYFFWTDKITVFFNEFITFFTAINYLRVDYNILDLITISIVIIIVLMSLSSLINTINRSVIKVRKLFFVTLWFLLVSFVLIVYSGDLFMPHLFVCMIPVTIIFSNYFEIVKKTVVPQIFLSILIVSIFLERFF